MIKCLNMVIVIMLLLNSCGDDNKDSITNTDDGGNDEKVTASISVSSASIHDCAARSLPALVNISCCDEENCEIYTSGSYLVVGEMNLPVTISCSLNITNIYAARNACLSAICNTCYSCDNTCLGWSNIENYYNSYFWVRINAIVGTTSKSIYLSMGGTKTGKLIFP